MAAIAKALGVGTAIAAAMILVPMVLMQPGKHWSASAPATDSAAAAAARLCLAHADDLQVILNEAEALGIMRRQSDGFAVDEARWAAVSYDYKVQYMLAVYCRSADGDGRGSAHLRGIHDGRIHASMLDGSYFD